MRVAVFDLEAAPSKALTPPAGSIAYVDTHDTATFAGFLGGAEIDLRQSLGLLDPVGADAARARRGAARSAIEARLRRSGALHGRGRAGAVAVLAALLEELGRSDAELVIVNIEDLWAETEPHNVPGTTSEHANFARRLARSIEDLSADDDLLGVLDRLDAARRTRTGTLGHGANGTAAGANRSAAATARAAPARERGRR
jgi:4-alpha-glucanotransferase